MSRSVLLAAIGLGAALGGCSARSPGSSQAAGVPTLTPQESGTTNRLQAISVVSPQIAWASGVGGTYVVTADGGDTWRAGVVPGTDTLEFRDVEAVSARVAYLLAAGPGTASRIYKTEDGGETWSNQFTSQDPAAFYDCFAFWGSTRGVVFSDAVNGRFPALRTTDGRTWEDIGDRLPPAQGGEGAFAASGTCVATQGEQQGWIVTAAAPKSRVLRTTDGGETWNAAATPIVQGPPSAGGATIAFRDPTHGILAGGDLEATTTLPTNNVAVTADGGATWEPASSTPWPGAAYGLSYVPGSGRTVVATGPGGAAWSPDEGRSWNLLPGVRDYWAVAVAGPRAGWLVGTGGRILKIAF